VRGQEATPSRPTILFNGARPGLFLGFIARGRAAGNYENLTGSLATKDPPRCDLSPFSLLERMEEKEKRFTPLAARSDLRISRAPPNRIEAAWMRHGCGALPRPGMSHKRAQDSRYIRAFPLAGARAFLWRKKRARLNSTSGWKMGNGPLRLSNFVRTINSMTQWRDILPNKRSEKAGGDYRRRENISGWEKEREADK